jgi:hypothetical protein
LIVAEFLQVLVVGAGKEIEERVEAAVERPPQLRDCAVEGMERQAGGRSVGELQRRLFNAFEGAFGDQTYAVDERVAGHPRILM